MVDYNNTTGLIGGVKEKSFGEYRLGDWRSDLPDQYAVTIIDRRPKAYTDAAGVPWVVTIRASLQEKISTRTEATWSPLTAGAFAQKIFGGLMQYITERSLVSQYASRRIWTGSTPLDFTLNLKFEAVKDTGKEVLRPIVELQRMSLPFSGVDDATGSVRRFLAKAFLYPPGPDPFAGVRIGEIREYFTEYKHTPDYYEDITVNIGRIMEIKRSVVKDVMIQQSPKFDRWGRPVEAIATVHFQTFEIVTKEDIDKIYKQTGVLSSVPEEYGLEQVLESL